MVTVNDFTIVQLEDQNFVVKSEGIHQDIDFVNGGFITTQTRAEEIRNLLIEQINTPIINTPSLEERIVSAESAINILLGL